MALKIRNRIWTRLASASLLAAAVIAGCVFLVRTAPDIEAHLSRPEGQAGFAGALSPDGQFTAVIRDDGAAEVRRADGEFVGLVRGHAAPLVDVQFTPDGKAVRTIDVEGGLRLTPVSALGLRDAALAPEPALREWAATRLWRPGGAQLVSAAARAEWSLNPASLARQLDAPSVRAPILPKGVRPQPGTMFRDCQDCPDMVVVPSGKFTMGSPASEEGRNDDEGPQRQVDIAAPLAVGRFEVTLEQFRQFTRATGHSAGGNCFADPLGNSEWGGTPEANWTSPAFPQSLNDPVVCINWEDARSYMAWLSGETGHSYRLLTEAEWEYAARAGTTTAYSFGTDADRGCGHMNGADARARKSYPDWTTSGCDDGYLNTAPAGSFAANAFGLYDMHGNVAEWVEDCDGDYSGAPPEGGAPTGECSARVIRGGSWGDAPQYLRSAIRYRSDPGNRVSSLGFRVARTLPP
ncbi:formylglycine-generating enzyme family protein [Hyphomonas sp.]|uniref:formylglycine-generating enzyme family protein n=1 Tax=Hyphomonas sp. TaxID=87 RepID=UPI0025B7AC90|nr:formylglycine-generating enzyme family protein [Hyphomonas sp.]